MFLSISAVLLSSLFLSACTGFWLALFVIFPSIIILNLEILSLFGAINPQNILIINFITLIISTIIWIKHGRSVPKVRVLDFFRKYFTSLKLDKSLAILSFCFIFLVVTAFLISAYTPVNEGDAKAYHIFRVLMYEQQGSFSHFITNENRNLVMPINTEIIYTWIYSFTKNDVGFQLVSFFSFFFAIGSIWGILSYIKTSFRKKLWSIFIFSSLAGIIAQTSSTQSDLITGSMLLGTVYFFLMSQKCGLKLLYLSSLCLALAMGIKSTGIMSIPVIYIFMAVILFKKKNFKPILYFSAFLLLNFIVFSSYNYILNFIDFSNPLGSAQAVVSHKFWGGPKAAFANFWRYMIQMFDFSGFTWGYFLNPKVSAVFTKFLALLNINPELGVNMKFEGLNCFLSEQTMGYGILGWLVFLPCCIFAFVYAFIKRNKKTLILGLLGATFFMNLFMLSISVAYMVFSIRFIAAFVALSAPVLVYSYFKKGSGAIAAIFKLFIILFAMFYMLVASTHLSQRPFYKLYKEFKTLERETFNNRTRCADFKFYKNDTTTCQLRDFIVRNYPHGLKIAFFLDTSSQLTSLKFLEKESNGAFKTDFLNMKYINSYNLNKYDIVVLNDNSQSVNTFKKDEDFEFNYITKNSKGDDDIYFTKEQIPSCVYFDKEFKPVYLKEKITIAKCIIKPEYLTNKGFTQIKQIHPTRLEFDTTAIKTFTLFSKPYHSDIINAK